METIKKYIWIGLAIFNAIFFTYVLGWCYVMIDDPMARFFSVAYLIFWIQISIKLIIESLKKQTK